MSAAPAFHGQNTIVQLARTPRQETHAVNLYFRILDAPAAWSRNVGRRRSEARQKITTVFFETGPSRHIVLQCREPHQTTKQRDSPDQQQGCF
jgi:hypothetical protein